MPGPGKKPRNMKVVAGTDRPDREAPPSIEHEPVSELPEAPDWLPNAHAVKEWDRLGPILVGMGLLTDASLSAFGTLCALHGKLVQLWSAGESPTGHMLAQYRALINDFGLTPVAQGKVRIPDEGKKGNSFANNGRRKA